MCFLLFLIVVFATGSRCVSRLLSFFLLGGLFISLGFFSITLSFLLFLGLVIADIDLDFLNLLVTLQSETNIYETLERLTEHRRLFNCKSRL